MSDSNNVLNREERVGSRVIIAEMRDFRKCIEACSLQELRSTGAFYTWNNKQSGDDKVISTIDKVMVNTEWITDLLASEVNFMSEGLYDHCLPVVHWEEGS